MFVEYYKHITNILHIVNLHFCNVCNVTLQSATLQQYCFNLLCCMVSVTLKRILLIIRDCLDCIYINREKKITLNHIFESLTAKKFGQEQKDPDCRRKD